MIFEIFEVTPTLIAVSGSIVSTYFVRNFTAKLNDVITD